MSESKTSVRAQLWAVKVEGAQSPFDTIHLKVYYPAGDPDRMSGIAAPNPSGSPYPVVIIAPGVNVGVESYGWLAERLAAAGLAVATYSWVGELFPGQYGITPGVVMERLSPEGWGTGPTSDAIAPVLSGLAALNEGPLSGALDLSRVVLGGHSGGGSVALHNATPHFFPQIVAGFSYAAHAGLAQVLGWPAESIVPPRGGAPFLFMNGTRDGVIAASGARYGVESWDPVRRTIDEALPPGSTYVVFDGANHFAMGYPEDPTLARGFLDLEATTPPEKTREAIAEITTLFCLAHARQDPDAIRALDAWVAAPPSVVSEAGTR